MNKLEFEKGRIKIYQKGNSWNLVETDTNLINKAQIDPWTRFVDKLKGTKITGEGSVYFQKEAVFPRHKLKEIVSNPVTRSMDKAEYVVVNKEYLSNYLNRIYYRNYYKDTQNSQWNDQYRTGPHVTNGTFFSAEDGSYNMKVLTFVQNLEGKKIILDEDLSALVPREVEIKGELYEKLNKMLGSNDKQTIKIGVEILSNLNYKEHEAEILLILNKNINNIRAYQSQHIVLFKSLIKTAQKDYPNWDTNDKLQFTLNLLERNQKNSVALQHINQYFNEVHPLAWGGQYQISIIEQVIADKIKENELDLQGKEV